MRHLKLYKTTEDYRENLSNGGGLTNLPKISLCADKYKVKYEGEHVKKAWFAYIGRDDLPLLWSCKGIESIKVNGKPLEGFEKYSEETVANDFQTAFNECVWEDGVEKYTPLTDYYGNIITNSNGETLYALTKPTVFSDKFTCNADVVYHIGETPIENIGFALNIDNTFGYDYGRVSHSDWFIVNEEKSTINLNLIGKEYIKILGKNNIPYILIYDMTNPQNTTFAFDQLIAHGTTTVYPTQEMIKKAPLLNNNAVYDGMAQLIEMEIEFNENAIDPTENYYAGLDSYNPGTLMGFNENFLKGLPFIPLRYNGAPLWKDFVIENGLATPIEYEHFEIPESVQEIGPNGLYGCGCTSITIPTSVKKIDIRAFYYCYRLTDLVIPDSVIDLGDYTCMACHNLTSITIGSQVTSIPTQFVSFCNELKSITSKSLISPMLKSSCFHSISPTGTLYYPKGSDYSTWLSELGDGWVGVEMEF